MIKYSLIISDRIVKMEVGSRLFVGGGSREEVGGRIFFPHGVEKEVGVEFCHQL